MEISRPIMTAMVVKAWQAKEAEPIGLQANEIVGLANPVRNGRVGFGAPGQPAKVAGYQKVCWCCMMKV